MGLTIKKLSKSFGDLKVYDDFELSIEENKITCILGPSGCGKTTLLKLISGIIPYDGGELQGFKDLNISYIFQEDRLLPWKTLGENIGFVLKSNHSEKEVTKAIEDALNLVQLREFKDYYPHEVSGGMKQRATMARAFAYPSNILLMDEPFKGLDLKLKKELLEVFLSLWLKVQKTVIFITHDVDEALMLGDEIYVLSPLPTKVKKHFTIGHCKRERVKKSCCLLQYKNELCNEIFI